jgi:hypothetical protein
MSWSGYDHNATLGSEQQRGLRDRRNGAAFDLVGHSNDTVAFEELACAAASKGRLDRAGTGERREWASDRDGRHRPARRIGTVWDIHRDDRARGEFTSPNDLSSRT